MAEPKSWEDALLNTSGEELIYEVEGDARQGNPLDIVTVAACYTCETVLGLEFPRKKVAKEMATRWNCHNGLVDALKLCLETAERCTSKGCYWYDGSPGRICKKCLAVATAREALEYVTRRADTVTVKTDAGPDTVPCGEKPNKGASRAPCGVCRACEAKIPGYCRTCTCPCHERAPLFAGEELGSVPEEKPHD